MRDYRRAGKYEIACKDCEHGRDGEPREWYQCWYPVTRFAGSPISKVSRHGTCAHAKAKVDTRPRSR